MIEEIFDGFFIKENHFSEWQEAKIRDVKAILSDRETPFTKKGKDNLPQFGIGKGKGTKRNKQLFPTSYIITEIDVPPSSKGVLNEREKFEKWSPIFIDIFQMIKADDSINYWAMYLTSSMCGIRFILKLDKPVFSKDEYENVAKSFLLSLSEVGIKEEYIDNNANHGWYVPTFRKYFDHRRKRFSIQSNTNKNNDSVNLFTEAIKLTKGKEKFTEGNRNKFIHLLACNANRYGIERLDTFCLIKENDYEYDVTEVEKTVNSVYQSNQTEFGKNTSSTSIKNATITLNQQIKKLDCWSPYSALQTELSRKYVFSIKQMPAY
ncbi:MAG: hypothetical protein HQ521_11940, partial [Bacteroidetes bacterium]|nr:hypothetical protein [Bacteroidota bacterium]